MKYQPKVSTTQKYSDSQGEHIVCGGRLVLLDQPLDLYPIIISETEEIVKGDTITNGKNIFEWDEGRNSFLKVYSKWFPKHHRTYVSIDYEDLQAFNKILALPEQFSDKHLQAIVDGKMKEGEVLVKLWGKPNSEDWSEIIWKIHLDQQNHITLFPAKQSLGEASYKYSIDFLESSKKLTGNELEQAFIAGAEWAVKNNYKGE